MHSVDSSLAAGSGQLSGCCGELAGLVYTILGTLLAAVWWLAVTSCRAAVRGGLAGTAYTILGTLLATVLQLVLACCRVAARGELAGTVYTTFCTLLAAAQWNGCDQLLGCRERGARGNGLHHHLRHSASCRPAGWL